MPVAVTSILLIVSVAFRAVGSRITLRTEAR